MARILLFLFLAFPLPAQAVEQIDFEFLWDQPETELELKMFVAPLRMIKRVGETGEFREDKDLPFVKEIADNKLTIPAGEDTVLYLVAKNPGKTKVRFFVSPHHIHPAEASLGFNFRCLCYNHIYTVEPGKLWYRVMLLKTEKQFTSKKIKLRHKLLKKR